MTNEALGVLSLCGAVLAVLGSFTSEMLARRRGRPVSRLNVAFGAMGFVVLVALAIRGVLPPEPSRPSLADVSSAEVSRAEPSSAKLPEPKAVPVVYPADPVQQAAFEAKYRLVYRTVGPPPSPEAQTVLGYWRLPRGYRQGAE